MARMIEEITIKIKISILDAIKLRIAGRKNIPEEKIIVVTENKEN